MLAYRLIAAGIKSVKVSEPLGSSTKWPTHTASVYADIVTKPIETSDGGIVQAISR
jgi:hypothetical protein